MKIVYQGIGNFRHAMIYNADGQWIATVKSGEEHEVIDALVENCARSANRGAEISTNEQEE